MSLSQQEFTDTIRLYSRLDARRKRAAILLLFLCTDHFFQELLKQFPLTGSRSVKQLGELIGFYVKFKLYSLQVPGYIEKFERRNVEY
jgi:hypothetical protein